MANLYTYNYGRDETALLYVVDHNCFYRYDAVDSATIHMLVAGDRVEWKDKLLNQSIQIVRQSDSFVEFRGDIKEVRFETEDRYNLSLRIKAPTWRLPELDIPELLGYYNGQHRVPRVLTAVAAAVLTDTGGADEPPDDEPGGYTSEDHVVFITPAADGSFTNESVEDSVTSNGDLTGGFAELNDNDPDTTVHSMKNDTTEWIQFNGSSANAKATVTGCKYHVIARGEITNCSSSFKLQYRDDDGSTWVDLVEQTFGGRESLLPFNTGDYTFAGYLATNVFLDGSDDWRFRILSTKGAQLNNHIRITSVVIDVYTDNVHSGDYYPIDSYADASATMNVLVDPDSGNNCVEGGTAVGDTYVIGKKNSVVLTNIFTHQKKHALPFTKSIDAALDGYTTKQFAEMTILDSINYICKREKAHWCFDHDTNTLEIDKEATILAVAEHEIVVGNVSAYGLSSPTQERVASVTVYGATYRREPDETEVTIKFTYPDDWDHETVGETNDYALKKFKIEDKNIRSQSEAAKLAKVTYEALNNDKPVLTVNTNTREDLWLGERLKITIDGVTYDTSYAVNSITIFHNVGDNDITQSVIGGWMGVPKEMSVYLTQAEILNHIASNIRIQAQYDRARSQSSKTYLTSDGLVPASKIIIANPDAGVDQTIAADGAEGVEAIYFSKNLRVIDGYFGATTVTIGDQTIGEDGELTISDAATPGLKIKDTGGTFPNSEHYIYFLDAADTGVFQIFSAEASVNIRAYGADNDLTIGTNDAGTDPEINFMVGATVRARITDTAVRPFTDNNMDLGTATEEFKDLFLDGTAHIDTLDVDINATVAGTLGVTGITTLASNVAFTGNTIEGAGWKRLQSTNANVNIKAASDVYLEAASQIIIRDLTPTTRVTIDMTNGDIYSARFVNAAGGFKDNGAAGVDGTFVDANAKVVTVSGGIITNLDT